MILCFLEGAFHFSSNRNGKLRRMTPTLVKEAGSAPECRSWALPPCPERSQQAGAGPGECACPEAFLSISCSCALIWGKPTAKSRADSLGPCVWLLVKLLSMADAGACSV